ncbi:hypothetical protein [Shewanella youngdeokensis]|uniref:Uncharacterized protein n=1 Tax=Shewanella youngdeokensis TaxID=2999068 RepID=A0ABZ0K2Q3_9GAMM|nr:hypothetical protein RGE70_06350 [Shewanella sp. DAU334]
MIWNWFSKKWTRTRQPQRKKVDINIPYEQHSYRKEDFDIKTPVRTDKTEIEQENSLT